MTLPNLIHYYCSTNLRILHYWIRADSLHDVPIWLRLQAASCTPCSLPTLVYTSSSSICGEYCKSTLVKKTLKIWNQLRHHFGFNSFSSQAKFMIPQSNFLKVFLNLHFVRSTASQFPSQPVPSPQGQKVSFHLKSFLFKATSIVSSQDALPKMKADFVTFLTLLYIK